MQPYSVPIVYQNDRFDNIKQMIDILDHLDKVSTNVFDTIEKKITKNRDALATVQKRTLNCAERVKSLIGRKTAITIISAPEHPAKDYIPSSTALFKDAQENHFKAKKIVKGPKEELKIYNPVKHFEGSVLRIKTPHELEKEFFANNKDAKEMPKSQNPYGLGHVPESIANVSNLLLFNTNEHVYRDYPSGIDPLQGRDVSEIPEEQRLNIDAPPNSLLRDDFMEFDVQRINFRPTIKDLAPLSLPQQLDLPDVIDIPWDMSFESSITSIAPSSVLSQLPKVEAQTGEKNAVVAPPSSENIPQPMTNGVPPPPPVQMSGPPPPPPPMNAGPPPPLPPTLLQTSEMSESEPPQKPKAKLEGVPSHTGDFLSSIRGFNKGELGKKRTTPNRPPVKEKPKATANVGGGDMMSALMKKISTRRLAIEGKHDKGKGEDSHEQDLEEIKAPVLTKKTEEKKVSFDEAPQEQAPPPPKKKDDDDWGREEEESEDDY